MSERWKNRFAFFLLFTVAIVIGFERLDNYDENYWNFLVTGALCIAGAAYPIWATGWRELLSEDVRLFFLRVLIFWFFVFFWWTEDYTTDYWPTVMIGPVFVAVPIIFLRWCYVRLHGIGARPEAAAISTPPPVPVALVLPKAEPRRRIVLTGRPAESPAQAAARFDIEIRYRGKEKWIGRRGDDAYWMEFPPQRSKPSEDPRVVFQQLDEEETPIFDQLAYFGLNGDEFMRRLWNAEEGQDVFGWRVLHRGGEEIPYNRQWYDGDFAKFVEVADPIGRRIHFQDHGDHYWVKDHDEGGSRPKWEAWAPSRDQPRADGPGSRRLTKAERRKRKAQQGAKPKQQTDDGQRAPELMHGGVVVDHRPSPTDLKGEPGESAASVAGRFGIDLRYRAKEKWLGRRGDLVYWMEYPPRPVDGSGKPNVVFHLLDEAKVPILDQLTWFGLDRHKFLSRLWRAKRGQRVGGWDVMKRDAEEVSRGEFAEFAEVVDPIGRRFRFEEHGNSLPGEFSRASKVGWER